MGRITWTDERARKLLVILNDEKDKGISKHNWANVAKIFNAQTSLNAHGKQVQNHYGDLKEKFKCWEDYQRMAGIAYNPRTGDVDVEERSLPRWKLSWRHSRYGRAVAKKELANVDLMHKLFGGQSAHGVGGCFSPAMANKRSYLSQSMEDLHIDINVEGRGDSEEDDGGDVVPNLSGERSSSPPKTTTPKVTRKRKSEETIDTDEQKRRQTSFDNAVKLLTNVAGTSNAPPPTKAQQIKAELAPLQLEVTQGDAYYIAAARYLY
ncbi:L10-interacting MYB domain-containing protein [Bienertia sinuspersici]